MASSDLQHLVLSADWIDRRRAVKEILAIISDAGSTECYGQSIEDYLEKLSKDTKWEVRNDLARAALKFRNWHCFDTILARLLEDSHYDVRRSAEQTLKRAQRNVNSGLMDENSLISAVEFEKSLRKIMPAKDVNKALHLSQKRFELFVRSSNHELKRVITPLQSRISKAKVIASKQNSNKLTEHLRTAEERCTFLARFLDDMESWIVDSPPAITREKLQDLIAEAFSLVQEYFEKKQPQLTVKHEIDVPVDLYVEVPRVSIIRAFRNIIQNSYEAMETSGVITVSGKVINENLVLIFHDNGCGITPDTRLVAFQPFTSTKSSTGLGLPIAHKIITQDCGGSITLPEQPKQGTIVLVQLPLSR